MVRISRYVVAVIAVVLTLATTGAAAAPRTESQPASVRLRDDREKPPSIVTRLLKFVIRQLSNDLILPRP